MPIVSMLEEIKMKIMILIHKRYELGNTWHDKLPLLVRRRVIDVKVESRALSVIFRTTNHLKSWKISLRGVL